MKSAKVAEILKKAMQAESDCNWSDAEGLFNDALGQCLNSESPAEVGKCYELLAAFLMRRGRHHESERLQRMASIFSNLDPASQSDEKNEEKRQQTGS